MTINNVEIEIERKPIKNLHLAVYPPDGRVHVSAPETYSEEQIRLFVLKKWVWLVQKRKEVTSYTVQDEREYVSGEAHYFKGELYRLKVIRDNTCTFHVDLQGDYINIYVYERTTKENIANVLWAWYKEQLTPTIEQYVAKWEKILDVKASEWTIQQMQSSWGKCHKETGKIMFNLQLAKKPLNCIEYVVAHELDKSYQDILDKNDNELLRNVKSVKYLETRRYREMLEFIQSAPFQVYIMGHSCGNSDRTLLNTVFEHENCVSIKPFYHKWDDGSDNYLELVQNISRNFTNMKLFRDRVVNKEQCLTI